MANKGRFFPKHPEKYAGNPGNILFRSSWELVFMKWLDGSDAVLKWASEEIKIPYIKPTDGRIHHYYPDFVVIYQDKNGEIQKEIVEVKPLKETLAEKAKSDYDKVALAINIAKWKAANIFAAAHGMKFRVITESSLFRQNTTKKTSPTKKTRGTTKSPRSRKI